jgi:predicted ABC-type ATPase
VKELVILGGPNGAGKTTAAQIVLPEKFAITELVNADEIARGLSPFDPEGAALAAGRLMLERMRTLSLGDRNFAIETTCSGRAHLNFLRDCKNAGWRITLVFLWLPSPELAVARVARRVKAGGHAIRPEIIIRRYWAGLRNMRALYLPLADAAAIYDNAGERPISIAELSPGGDLIVHDTGRWKSIEGTSPWPT